MDTPVPRFYLYGEPHRVADRRFVHLEALDDRSRPSEWTIRPHAHADLHHIFHIRGGGGAMRAEAAILAFEAPCLIVVPAGVVHGFSWQSESNGSVLTVSSAYVDLLRQRNEELRGVFALAQVARLDAAGSTGFATACEALLEELSWNAPGHRAAAEAGLLGLIVRTMRATHGREADLFTPPGRQAALVARYRERVETHFRAREPVGVYAAALGTTESRLRAACQAAAGQTPTQILDQRAFVEAQRALLYSNLSVAEIANTLGFDDAHYFSRYFRRCAGCSPRSYRAAHADTTLAET